jgi:fumarylacetoacetate (FAA) hydrolase
VDRLRSQLEIMKLATLRNGTRDGQLVVVSRDLVRALPVPQIAATLQGALDDWGRLAPRLQDAADALETGNTTGSIPFDPATVLAPLPRSHHWVDGARRRDAAELLD